MSRAWSSTSVHLPCAQLQRSPGNCSADPRYARSYKPLRFSNRTPLRVSRACHRGSSIAQPLEMQLLHATVIGFGNGNQITVDLNLFAGLRQMPEQMCHVTADSAYVRAF